MTGAALRRKSKPNDLRGWNQPSGFLKPRPGEVHDRRAEDKFNSEPVPVEIIDPMGLNFGDKIVTMRETRGDQLAKMRSQDLIADFEYAAGRHWQDAHENSQIGTVRAIDPAKEYVDGGRAPEMLSDRQQEAARDVSAVAALLGPFGNALIHDVLAARMSIRAAGLRRGMTSGDARVALMMELRRCLGEMAVLFGLSNNSN